MANRVHRRSRRSRCLWLALALAVIAMALSLTGNIRQPGTSLPIDALEWVVVRRDDLDATLLAGGDVQATRAATVTCQVEDITDSDGTLILSVIGNGTVVKKGDELCRLDSSELEELAREEEIMVNQARALTLQARLVFETAEIALRAYQEGLVAQLTKEFEGRIALGRSDTQRQADRLAWTGDMVVKGYLSHGQLLSERQTYARTQHELRKAEGEFQLFRRFEVPKEIHTLRSQIKSAEINLRVEADRLKAEEDELAYLRGQIDKCTIRAPKQGVVIHSTKDRGWGQPLVEAGKRVKQDEELFVLPDLTQMEVQVSVHESMGPRVQVGMKADVRLAAMVNRALSGRVTAIDQLPSRKQWWSTVKHFIVRVRLDKTPACLLPYMSAEVTFDTGRVLDALVIPVEAMTVVAGRQSCYVIGLDGLECRAITTRRATMDLLEVTSGLNEGERVVLRSHDVEKIPVEDRKRDPLRESPHEYSAPPSHLESPAQRMDVAYSGDMRG